MDGAKEERGTTHQMVVDGSSLPVVGCKRCGRTFDVFISFRGGDTRRSFTSHLSSALYKKGVDVFVDDRLERGDEISEALLEAIEGSKMSLVVFSKDYASSRWCLDELVHILQCKNTMDQLVIPIFYDVDPSHVRWQQESFVSAFAKHEARYSMEKLNQWKSALKEVANLSGHNSTNFNSDPELIDAIVRDTIENLHRRWYRPNTNPGLVGIESRMEEVMRLLDIREPDIRVVGIWGMGGIGKTTLAEAVFDRISGDFEGSYFFRNVSDTGKKGDLVEKRNQGLSKILGEDLHIGTSTLPSFVVDRLHRKRVLFVLDDVNHQRQLEILFQGIDESGAGSRVIITTRDKQVLSFFPKVRIKVYGAEALNNDEALQLFRCNAYVSNHEIEAYDELAMRVIDYASGIPLALKVFARSLRGKDKHKWESALNKLGRVANLEIMGILKVSYDALEDEEVRNIFLDIACFFKGQDKDQVVRLLDGCYEAGSYGLDVLEDKALITIKWNQIEMPDPLQELGWDIVQQECKSEPGRRSRLWRPEDVHCVLKRSTGTETIRGIFLDLSKVKELNISPNVFEKMYNLKLLKFHNNTGVNTKVCLPLGLQSLPDELRYLCWHGIPLKCLPPAFCPENLVELDMSQSNFHQLWSGTQSLSSLKILKLTRSKKLKELPDLSEARNLEKIYLDGCCQIDEFPKIPTNIQELVLSKTAIEEVPSSIQHLSRLVTLYLNDCERLEKLPDTLSSLDSLETLNLSNCKSIKKLPDLPRKIEYLDLSKGGVEELSSSIGSLCMLSQLDLTDCRSLKCLPSDIWKMQSLKKLDLSYCSVLEEIPEVLETNECLEKIDLSGTAIRELPSSIERLVRLKSLWVNKLFVLPETLWNLEHLVSFGARGTTLRQLPPFKKDMTQLTSLSISGCDSNDPMSLSVPPLSRVCFLKVLGLKDLHIVQIPDDIGCLISLSSLDLSGNDFEILPASIKHLSKLERLDISYCRKLKSLPELPNSLVELDAHDCASLETISGNMEFLADNEDHAKTLGEMYFFSYCLRLQGDVSTKILAAAKLWYNRNVMVCLPGNNIPDWFTHRERGPSITFQWPRGLWDENSIGFAFCISVSFMDYSPELGLYIRGDYRFDNGEGDYSKKPTSQFHVKALKRRRTRSQSVVQNQRLRSDHIFLFYDAIRFYWFAREARECDCKAVTITFDLLDGAFKPLECCRVEKCGYYIVATPPLSAPDSV